MKAVSVWIKVLLSSSLALVLIFGPWLYMNNYFFAAFIACWLGMLIIMGYLVYIVGQRVSSSLEQDHDE